MFDFEFLPTVKGEVLDDYLAKGWFRIGLMLHTVDRTTLDDGKSYPVRWLRYNVKAVRLYRNNTKIISANSHFTTHCRTFQLNDETELLFKKYLTGTRFRMNTELDTFLGDISNHTFESKIMEVRHDGRLIAAGLFDIGTNSIAHIISYYDHAYKKHSLGKFLIISIYKYCLEHGYGYYYPGYYLPGQEVLSYKLFLDKNATQVYLPEQDAWKQLLN